MYMKVLGVDCEGVIFKAVGGEVPRALESLRQIADSGEFDKIYIVSRVNLLGRVIFPVRLILLNFWDYTGIPRVNIYFCRHDEDKAVISKRLGITDFIDDRFEVLKNLDIKGERYAFNPRKRKIKKFPEVAEEVVMVSSWDELTPLLIEA